MEINLDSASKDELIQYAETLGVEVGSRDNKPDIADKIRLALGEPVAESAEAATTASADKRVKIRIAKDSQDKQDVFIGVNGTGYRIKRGEIVEVPESVVHVLRNAIQHNYDAENNRSDSLAYPFEIIS